MDDSSSLHSDVELNAENQPSKNFEPTKKPLKRKVARKRPTHVRLQNQFLYDIPNLQSRKDSFVLYLYNNRIESIANLDILTKLTHLYLSHNNIRRLENIGKLISLEKLYIGHNKISVLEGLENLHRLRELHMEDQRLPDGDALTFDPRSIQAVQGTLHVLKIDNNGVTSLDPLKPLSYLTDLCCSGNNVGSLVDLSETLHQLFCLIRLDLKGNPICELRRYRDVVVENAPELKKLDDMDVTPAFRQFISGRVQAVARRMSAVQQKLAATSVSDNVISRDLPDTGVRGLRHPQVTLSQGNLVQPRRTPVTCQPRQASSTHLRIGNMLTLTPQQKAFMRNTGQRRAQSDVQLETSVGSSGKFETPEGGLRQLNPCSRRRDTLPSSPAKRPVGADAGSASLSKSQPCALAESSSGDLGNYWPWQEGEGAALGGREMTPLRQTMSEEVPKRMNMLAIMP